MRKSGSLGLLFFILCLSSVLSVSAQDDETSQTTDAELDLSKTNRLSQDDQGRFVVDAYVGKQGPFPFVIDTAASRTVAYRRLPVALGVEALKLRSKRIYTATGRTEALVYPIPEISALGSTIYLEETVAIADPPGRKDVYGLIGIDLLRGKTLAFYLNQARVQLFQNLRDLPSYDSWRMTQGRPVGYGSLAITLEMEGLKVPAILDTGASFSIMTSATYQALPSSARGPKKRQNERLTRILSSSGVSAGRIVEVDSLKVGEVEYEQVEIIVSDLPIFRAFGASDVPAIIIGTDVLGRGEFAIDLKNWRFYQR